MEMLAAAMLLAALAVIAMLHDRYVERRARRH